jgi:hypothetical protein
MEYMSTSVDFRTESGIRSYAATLGIVIPESSLKAMMSSVRQGRCSPSHLAQYLEGTAYARFLQTDYPPRISERRFLTLQGLLGERYNEYVVSLQTLSKRLELSETFIDHTASRQLTDPNGCPYLPFISNILSEAPPPALSLNTASIAAYSRHEGVPMDPIQAEQLLSASHPSPREIKRHIFACSYTNFTRDPKGFSDTLRSYRKEHAA